jgi:hypothetical protein
MTSRYPEFPASAILLHLLPASSHRGYNVTAGENDRKLLTEKGIQRHISLSPTPVFGRRAGLKIRWGNSRVGSSPTFGTINVRRISGMQTIELSAIFLHTLG